MHQVRFDRLWKVAMVAAIIVSSFTACGSPTPSEPVDKTSPTPTTETFLSPPPTKDEVYTSPISPTAMLPEPALEPGFGGVQGSIAGQPAGWEGQEVFAYLAPFTPVDEDGAGIYVLETTVHPSTQVATNGAFQMGNISPGSYVLVIGPTPEEARVLADGDRPRVFEISEGEILDLGRIRLDQ